MHADGEKDNAKDEEDTCWKKKQPAKNQTDIK